MKNQQEKHSFWWKILNLFAGLGPKGDILRARVAIWLFLISVLIGTSWFFLFEGYTLIEAFFMTAITVSTVGFEEVKPLSEAGLVFVSIYILLNIGIFAYSLSVFSYHIIEGEYFKKRRQKIMEKKLSALQNHIIVCGYGRYGKEVCAHFREQPYVIIERDPAVLEELQAENPDVPFLAGDSSQDDLLLRAGITRASSLISVLGDDGENILTVLTARQLNPRLNIISRAQLAKNVVKLKLAGANQVMIPEQIGGFYMSTLVTEPHAVELFTHIATDKTGEVAFEELSFEDLASKFKGVNIRQMDINEITGATIIGYRMASGKYKVNPSREVVLEPGSSLLVIGNSQQLKKFKEYYSR